MSALRREAIGPFAAEAALRVESLTGTTIRECLLPPSLALGEMPQIVITAKEQERLGKGQAIVGRETSQASELAAVNADGALLAVLSPDGRGHWKPAKNFAATGSAPMP